MARTVLSQVYRGLSWRLVVGAVAIILFAWFGSEVREGETQAFDAAVRDLIHSWASPGLTSAFRFASFVGSPPFLFVLGVLYLAFSIRLKLRRPAAFFIITMAGELVIETSLKLIYARARPEAFFDYPLPSSFSFPSGHAFGSVCFFGIIAWGVARRFERLPARVAVWAVAVFMMIFIGLSRIYLGVHYPTDVLAGFVGGWIWLSIVLVHRHRNFRRARPE